MKRFAAFALALTLFTAPVVALADVYDPLLSEMFNGDVETIVHPE
ncbi:MAG: hypothetical protein O6826_07785 [Acidobacteria bacterium]|nr:hypothetical protein [Acidobacteriota bacterium]